MNRAILVRRYGNDSHFWVLSQNCVTDRRSL